MLRSNLHEMDIELVPALLRETLAAVHKGFNRGQSAKAFQAALSFAGRRDYSLIVVRIGIGASRPRSACSPSGRHGSFGTALAKGAVASRGQPSFLVRSC